jgi:drug/metabolite transporter (DMT)-like permease
MTTAAMTIDRDDWLLLILLSVLWGGAFFFTGVAVKELPPLTIVLARVALASALLVPAMWICGGAFPSGLRGWFRFFVMALVTNVIPFSLLVMGQTRIAGSLASVLNATTPLFTVLVMAAFREEALSAHRIAGAVVGVIGVVVLYEPSLQSSVTHATGILLCLGAALSYGFSALWARRALVGIPPLTSATCQLLCSSLAMLVLAGTIEWPHGLAMPSLATGLSLLGAAALSTALAYLVFFQIIRRSGASNVMLVTLLIPVTAILLGHFALGETLRGREILGGLIIASALIMIDGRVFVLFRRPAPQQ